MRTRYRTRGFSPPPSPLGPADGETSAGTDHGTDTADPTLPSPAVVEAGARPGVSPGAEEAVSISKSAAADATAEGDIAAETLGPISTKRGGVEEEPSSSDEPIAYIHVAGTASPRAISPATPAPEAPGVYRAGRTRAGTCMYSHSSPIRPLMIMDSDSGPSTDPISAADAALIEISNHNFFTRHRIHEAAVAHQVACEIALERVKQHQRLGTRPDDWDEDLALEGLPPVQRWKKRPGPGDGLEEKENER